MTRQNNGQAKRIKFGIVTITVFLILLGVLTNDKPAEYNFGLVVIIGLLMSIYILPFIEKKDMIGWMSIVEYNQDNLGVRIIFMVIAVVVSILSLYELLI